jgi:hypothetical protein
MTQIREPMHLSISSDADYNLNKCTTGYAYLAVEFGTPLAALKPRSQTEVRNEVGTTRARDQKSVS